MKKDNILNLIKYHVENNDLAFKDEAYEIAKEFDNIGDYQIHDYILTMIQDYNFVPQYNTDNLKYLTKLVLSTDPLLLPDSIVEDLMGIGNAINKKTLGVNKFLFSGKPGTGKTEAVKQLGRILNKDVYSVETSMIIDSKLGQTLKNIDELFEEINNLGLFSKAIVLIDEIDSLALDRINENDLREMGRATSQLLKSLDKLNQNVVLIATTNLKEKLDKALTRRFDFVIDFDRYTNEDLIDVANKLLDFYLQKYKLATKDSRLFNKILNLYKEIPNPAELKNTLKTAIAFCNPEDNKDYLKNLYTYVVGAKPDNIELLKEQGFTLREIEMLSGISKSSLSRQLRNNDE